MFFAPFQRCCNKRLEQRMRAVGAGLEFGVELYADIERMVWDLDCFNQLAGGRGACNQHTLFFDLLTEIIIEFITVAVALGKDVYKRQV